MVTPYDDEEREKLSWREIDRRKDQSKHVSGEKPFHSKGRSSQWAMKHYRKEAEKLFAGKKGTEEYKRAINEIQKYHGTAKFNGVAKKFVGDYGLPDSWDTLFLFLDYKDSDTVIEVMAKLNSEYRERSLHEMLGFKAKLEIIAMMTTKKELRAAAQRTLKNL